MWTPRMQASAARLSRGEGFSPLPFVDRLGRGQAEELLQLPDGKTAGGPEESDFLTGEFHINTGDEHLASLLSFMVLPA